jgi:hypothetical protein
LPPENGLRSSSVTAWSAPESQSTISPEAFLAASMQKMPATVTASQPQCSGPAWAASAVPSSIPATEASVILGSATRQTP